MAINPKQKLGLTAGLMALLSAFPTMASNCIPLTLIDSRNDGVTVSKNSCQENQQLATGSKLQIASGSRLWLQFDAGDNFELTDAQIICQNKTDASLTINISSANLPWLSLKNKNYQCKQWANNRMSCDSNKGAKNSFFCAIAETKQANSPKAIKLGTSVTMRATGTADKIIHNVKSEVNLCKNLYHLEKNVTLSWTVLASGAIKNLQIDNKVANFRQCVENVVTGVNYGTPERLAKPATKYSRARAYIPAKPAQEVMVTKTLF